jgi:hypothetical protein
VIAEMPRKMSKEQAAEYMREWRKRKKQSETELDRQIAHVKLMQEIAAQDVVKERREIRKYKNMRKPKPRWLRREINRRNQLPEDGMCACGRGPLKSRQFVISNGAAMCLICYRNR